MGLLRNIRLARDAARIAADGRYCVDGNEVALPRVDLREVKVISPEDGAGILAECQGRCKPGGCCVIRVVAEDSFEAAMRYERPLVMSFAKMKTILVAAIAMTLCLVGCKSGMLAPRAANCSRRRQWDRGKRP